MTRSQLGNLAIAILFIGLSPGTALAHDYSAPFFYMGGIYATEGDRNYPPASDEEMGWLLKMIQDDSKDTRAIAAGALGQTRDKRAVEPLIAALTDKAMSVRMNAAMGFVHIVDPRAVEPLKAVLNNPQDDYLFLSAEYALVTQGDAAVDALVGMLAHKGAKSAYGNPCFDAAEIIFTAKGESAALDWAVAKMKSPDKTMQRIALSMLSYLDDSEKGKAKLPDILRDATLAQAVLDIALSSEEDTSWTALCILGNSQDRNILDKLIAAAGNKSRKDRATLYDGLRGMSNPYIDSQLRSLKDGVVLDDKAMAGLVAEVRKAHGEDEDLHPALSAAEELAASNSPKAIKALIRLLNDPNTRAVEVAMEALAGSDNATALDILVKAARNPKNKSRTNVAWVLVFARNPRLLPFYVSILSDKDEHLVSEVIGVLGQLGDRRATKHLAALLAKKDRRSEVLTALTQIKDPEAIGAIIALLKPANGPIQDQIIGALAAYGSDGVSLMIPKLKDSQPSVRLAAARYFQKVRDARAVDPLVSALGDENKSVVESVIGALIEQHDAKGIAATAAMLKDKDLKVRRVAAYAAAISPNPEIADALGAMLKDPDRRIRECAGLALSQLGDKRGADAMMHVLVPDESDEERSMDLFPYAVSAAGKLKDKSAVAPILQTLGGDISLSTFEHVSDEEHARSRRMKLDALREITGQDFGCAYYRWIAYWVAQGNEFDLEMGY
ncbi:MAG: HEAT repeat domain-containing protein [Armatimonadota bacterium]|nr:HEAT repeat domain-containing protein [bacterium]